VGSADEEKLGKGSSVVRRGHESSGHDALSHAFHMSSRMSLARRLLRSQSLGVQLSD